MFRMLILPPSPVGAVSACLRRVNSTFTYLIYIRDVLDGKEMCWYRRTSTTQKKRLKTPQIFNVLSALSFPPPKTSPEANKCLSGGSQYVIFSSDVLFLLSLPCLSRGFAFLPAYV